MKLKKYRGQHLLVDCNMLNKIAESAHINKDDHIIEIGAGTGLLTELLAEAAESVMSFEIDKEFEGELKGIESQHPNLKVIFGDFMKWDMEEFLEKDSNKWRIVANIPYNITSPILEKLIMEGRQHLADAHILMQKEVAQRITAKPGTKDYGRLSVFVQYFCEAKLLYTVPPTVFEPPPKVDSAVLYMKFKDYSELQVNKKFEAVFFNIVKASFALRRKQLQKTLRSALQGFTAEEVKGILERSGIDGTRRGETLSMEEFERIALTVMG